MQYLNHQIPEPDSESLPYEVRHHPLGFLLNAAKAKIFPFPELHHPNQANLESARRPTVCSYFLITTYPIKIKLCRNPNSPT